jgi:adenosylcobinamide-GDP ribazoletransferase
VSGARPGRDAGLAVSLLTIVPTPARLPEDGSVPQVSGWFPFVGLALGTMGFLILELQRWWPVRPFPPLLLSVLVVVAWALLTRMMHFDGLADVADAFWGSHDAERRLEIMADSATGAFGTTAIVLVALLEVSAIYAVINVAHGLPVLIAPVVARFSATCGAWFGTPARSDGLGRSVIGSPTAGGVVPAALCLALTGAVAWWGFGMLGVGLFLGGLLVAAAVPHLLSSRFGGVNGDVLGASVLITEAVVLAAFAMAVV